MSFFQCFFVNVECYLLRVLSDVIQMEQNFCISYPLIQLIQTVIFLSNIFTSLLSVCHKTFLFLLFLFYMFICSPETFHSGSEKRLRVCSQ